MNMKARLAILGCFLVLLVVTVWVGLNHNPASAPPPPPKPTPSALPATPPPPAAEASAATQSAAPSETKTPVAPDPLQAVGGSVAEGGKTIKKAGPGIGSVTGVVRDEKDTRSIPDASITLELVDWKGSEEPKDHEKRTTTSDAEGKFAYENVPFGHYVLTAVKDDNARSMEGVIDEQNTHREVTLKIRAAGSISGVVHNAEGKPIAGALVLPHQRDTNGVYDDIRANGFRTKSDANGQFTLANIQAGKWKLYARAKGYAALVTDYIAVGEKNAQLVLTGGGSIKGRVIDDATKQGAPNLSVVLGSDAGERGSYSAKTDKDGNFQISNVRPADYVARLESPVLVLTGNAKATVTDGKEATVELHVVRGGSVAGRVYDKDTNVGIAGAKMRADGPGKGAEATSDASGNYRINGLVEGNYQVVRSETPGYGRGDWRERSQVAVKLGQDITGVDFPCTKGAPVSGAVFDRDGQPAAKARIEARSGNQGDYADAQTKDDGTFEVFGLQASDKLSLRAQKDDLVSEIAGPMPLPAEGVQGIVLTLGTEAGIDGVVVDNNGRPVANVGIMATSGEVGFGGASERSDPKGAFKVRKLSQGTYKLYASRGNSFRTDKAAAVVPVEAGQVVTGVQLVLTEEDGLTIGGHVTDEAGKAIGEAQVNAWNRLGSNSDTMTDSSGAYTLTGLKEGDYSIRVYHHSHSQTNKDNIPAGSQGIDFVLAGRGTIEGRVLDAKSGEPVKDFEITQFQGDRQQIDAWVYGNMSRMHSDDGSFSLKDVEVGAATVVVRASGHAPGSQVVPNVMSGQTVSGVEIRLEAGRSVDGVVTDSKGTPLTGAMVFLNELPQEYVRERSAVARSAADGTFHVDTVGENDKALVVFLTGYAPGRVDISPNVRVTMSPGGTVEGTVTVGNQPVADQYVNASFPGVSMGGGMSAQKTDAKGFYRITGLPTGEGTIIVSYRPDGDSSSSYRARQQKVIVEDGKVTTANINFPVSDASVEGTVTKDGQPVSGMVAITSGEGDNQEQHSGQIDSQGHYRVDNLPAARR